VIIMGGVLESDAPLQFKGKIVASRTLVHLPDGKEFTNSGVQVTSTAVGIEASVALPCTDLAVWGDGKGGVIDVSNGKQSHVYTISGSWLDANGTVVAQLAPFSFPLPQGNGSDVSLGDLIPSTSAGGATILIPDEWSAQVTAAQAAASAAEAAAQSASTASDSAVKALIANPGSQTATELNATFVAFRNHDGTPVAAPKVVVITLTEDGTDIDNIAVYANESEVGQ